MSMQVSALPPVIDVPPPIGSSAWDRELVALGVDRATVDRELRLAVAAGIAEPDGHDVYLNDASPQTAAVLVLFHQQRPSYSALMYLRFVWDGSGGRLRSWIVRQYAAMLVHGPRPVTDSATYGLTIDYFEHDKDAAAVLAALLTQVQAAQWGGILRAAGPLPWPAKRHLFLTAAEMPALHAPLGEAMAASFYGTYGDIDAPEAAELLRRITVVDDRVRAALVEATSQPIADAVRFGDRGDRRALGLSRQLSAGDDRCRRPMALVLAIRAGRRRAGTRPDRTLELSVPARTRAPHAAWPDAGQAAAAPDRRTPERPAELRRPGTRTVAGRAAGVPIPAPLSRSAAHPAAPMGGRSQLAVVNPNTA
ncbi:hypothetical protein [Dactylosporangium sp. NPDC005555]|uniref:hypothetical protein n=1 Tax=Dactylosporangium sp. NPDC005555 TaxID=3154889 RepID=UPI0033B23A5D